MLFFQLALTADTLMVRQVPAVRSGFEQVVFVAQGLTSILVLILTAVILIGVILIRSKVANLSDKLEEVLADLRPMAQKSAAMSEGVSELAKNMSEMVAESRDTVKDANRRVRRSMRKLTDRVDEASELIGRVNASADRVANIASGAVGGIKLGARALGLRPTKEKKGGRKGGSRPRLRRS